MYIPRLRLRLRLGVGCVPGVEAVRGTGLRRHYIEVGGCCLRPVLVDDVRPIGRPPPPRPLEDPLCIAVRSPRSGLRPRSNRGLRPRIDNRPPPGVFPEFCSSDLPVGARGIRVFTP